MEHKDIPDLESRQINFGTILKKALKDKETSQADLSKMTGISTALIYKYCSNKSQPSAINFLKISDALKISPNDFFPAYYQVLLNKLGLPQTDPEVESTERNDLLDALEREVKYWKEKYYLIREGKGGEQIQNITPTEVEILEKYEKLKIDSKTKINDILFDKTKEADKWDEIEKDHRLHITNRGEFSPTSRLPLGAKLIKEQKNLSKALLLLTKKQQLLISLRFFDDNSIAEISEKLNLQQDEVQDALERAVRMLKSEMSLLRL